MYEIPFAPIMFDIVIAIDNSSILVLEASRIQIT